MTATMQTDTRTPLERFVDMLAAHDIHYHYSDDMRVWKRGAEEYRRLVETAAGLPREDVLAFVQVRTMATFPSQTEAIQWQQAFEDAMDRELGR